VLPLVIMSVISIVLGFMQAPIAMRVMEQNPPGNMTAEQFAQARGMIETMQKVGSFFAPIIIVVITLISAGLLLLMCFMLGLKPKMSDLFTILMYSGLIVTLGQIAGFLVVRAKADQLQSIEELRPALGLDIFIHTASKPVQAILNYFSIFTIWYLVALTVAVAALTGASKGKAFIAIIPVILIGMLLMVGITMMQR
jgi:hypothetical protein